MMRESAVAVTVALLFQATAMGAQVGDMPNLLFNGFGTAGLVHSDEDQADFASSVLAPEGAGATSDWSGEVDSRLGLQLTANLTPQLSSVAQVIVEQRHDDTYTPTVEWANVKYEIAPDFYIRGGRIVLPGVMASEYRKVGYALPWVRPPLEVYNLVPVSNSDGVDAGYEFRAGGFINTVRLSYGRRDVELPDGNESEARELWALSAAAERGPFGFHLGYLRSRVTVETFRPLFNGFRQLGPEGNAIADRFDFEDKTVEFVGLGARYDPGDWFIRGQLAFFDSRTVVGDSHGWYVTGGYRFGSVTPYVTLARVRPDSDTSHPGLTLAGRPPPVAATAAALNAGLNQALGAAAAQKSISVGTRWDFARNLAMKVQFDYLDLDSGSPGVLINEQPGFERGGTVSLFSVALDFVF